MKKIGRFAITLAAAGYLPHNVAAAPGLPRIEAPKDKSGSLFQIMRGQHKYTLAGHRSHSSHSSHRSSSGGGYATPRQNAPSGNSTAPNYVMPQAPAAPALPGNSGIFKDIVKRVQTALYAYGYYTGAIDGVVGSGTKAAISKFQMDWALNITGTITPEVLDALNIVAK